jgi:hypothetical protein
VNQDLINGNFLLGCRLFTNFWLVFRETKRLNSLRRMNPLNRENSAQRYSPTISGLFGWQSETGSILKR